MVVGVAGEDSWKLADGRLNIRKFRNEIANFPTHADIALLSEECGSHTDGVNLVFTSTHVRARQSLDRGCEGASIERRVGNLNRSSEGNAICQLFLINERKLEISRNLRQTERGPCGPHFSVADVSEAVCLDAAEGCIKCQIVVFGIAEALTRESDTCSISAHLLGLPDGKKFSLLVARIDNSLNFGAISDNPNA